jgi:high affinity sulfate transporter 1
MSGSASRLASWLPGLQVARDYRLAWLRSDLAAGLILTAMLVPAGMAYAEAAGLPAITGLYATILPLLAYAVFGPSRILVVGPDSGLAPLIAAAIVPLAVGDDSRAVALAGMLGLLTGAICILAGLARLGFITELLSKPARLGYMNGIALTVIVSQLPRLFGFSVDASGVIPGTAAFALGVAEGETVPAALAIGAASLALILAARVLAPRFPAVLAAVVLATIAVVALGLAGQVPVVGPVPQGLPVPALPSVTLEDLATLFPAALGIALVSFAETSVLSRTFAIRGGYEVDSNREVLALGVADAASGLMQGFPISSSASRTPVAESAGAKTQLTGVVGALAIAILLVAAPGLVHDLPMAALAAVVISAAMGLFEIEGMRRLYRVRRAEFLLALASFLAVAVFGVLNGIAIAVGLSLLDFIRRAWRPHDAILGRVTGLKGYHDVIRYPEARQVPGLLLFRWDAPLFFANADLFRNRVRSAVVEAPATAREAMPPILWVVVASEPITDIDSTAADMLRELEIELRARGVELCFAEMKDPVRDRLVRYGFTSGIGRELFFPTLGVAVRRYLDAHPVPWVDWEDERRLAEERGPGGGPSSGRGVRPRGRTARPGPG